MFTGTDFPLLSLPAQTGICCAKHTPGNMTRQTWSDNSAVKEPCFYKEPDNGAEVKNPTSYPAVGNCLSGIVPTD